MHSPCVAKCGLNDDDFCMGCFRHINEIVGWGKASDEKKQQIWALLPERKQTLKGGNSKQVISRDKWLAAEGKL